MSLIGLINVSPIPRYPAGEVAEQSMCSSSPQRIVIL